MPKSRAEIQKAYRERLKAADDAGYLKKERERRRRNYIPAHQLTNRERCRRNAALNVALKRHRKRKADIAAMQAAAAQSGTDNEAIATSSSGYHSDGSHSNHSPLIVRLPFPNRRAGPRKRISRALSKKTRELTTLKSKYHELQKKYRTSLRRLQRTKAQPRSPRTPRSKTDAQIRAANLNGHQAKKIRRQLLLGNAIVDEVKSAKKQNLPSKMKAVHSVIAGRIVKKYRCVSQLCKATGFARNSMARTSSKSLSFTKQSRLREVRRYKQDVMQFLERDDNSRHMPGKADKVKTGAGSTQKRVLTDYIGNLHKKFLSENPSVKLSLTSFQRIRPKYILPTAFITRHSSLCTKHQNMALLLKALRREGIDAPMNPESFIATDNCESMIDAISDKLSNTEIKFDEWKRVAIEERGNTKMVMRIVASTKTKHEFLSHLRENTNQFVEHVRRMRNQYEQIRILKQQLPPNHAVVHMDFAENYSCKSMQEIQSAYWNQTGVTLHPTVIYTKSQDDTLQHRSLVLISDDLNHNANAVVTFVKQIVFEAKDINPQLEHIHYWSDSPTSQYRNKTIFHLIANHEQQFDLKANWNYFEAGHGKGPCDGLGGSTKRLADEAMKSGKVTIQDAGDFYAWTQSPFCSMRNVTFRFVSKEKCVETSAEIEKWDTKPIKGTMKIHAVTGLGSNAVLVRNTSCYCTGCLGGPQHCDGWVREETSSVAAHTSGSSEPDVVIGGFVAATYDNKVYIGQIIDIDMDDELPYKISFMESSKSLFRWPKHADVIWCMKADILFTISAPTPSGKTKRLYKIDSHDFDKIQQYD